MHLDIRCVFVCDPFELDPIVPSSSSWWKCIRWSEGWEEWECSTLFWENLIFPVVLCWCHSDIFPDEEFWFTLEEKADDIRIIRVQFEGEVPEKFWVDLILWGIYASTVIGRSIFRMGRRLTQCTRKRGSIFRKYLQGILVDHIVPIDNTSECCDMLAATLRRECHTWALEWNSVMGWKDERGIIPTRPLDDGWESHWSVIMCEVNIARSMHIASSSLPIEWAQYISDDRADLYHTEMTRIIMIESV